jgi:hypothetical protein
LLVLINQCAFPPVKSFPYRFDHSFLPRSLIRRSFADV